MKIHIQHIFTTVALLAGLQQAVAQGTAFTYQGRLNDGTNPATGSYDLRFTIYDSLSNPGGVIAGPLTNSATGVTNGVFTSTLDFGTGVFTGPDRWLEIAVRTNIGGTGAFAALSPRQKLTPTPYAITAGNLTGIVPNAGIGGTYSAAVTFNNAANSFAGNGGGLTNVNAATLGGFGYCSLPCYWNILGNAGTSPTINFLGTTDNQALRFKVNNTIVLQFSPGTTLPNVVAGLASFHPSVIASGVSGAVIAGGNAPSGGVNGFGGGDFMAVYDNDGAIGGGFGNKVGSNNGDITDGAFATVAGGVFNGAANYAATVAGGDGNLAGGQRSFVGGGFGNQAQSGFSSLGGGLQNSILSSAEYATVGGGNNNQIQSSSTNSTIAGGFNNVIQSTVYGASIGGGIQNTIKLGTFGSPGATIAGGQGNTIETEDPRYATIGGGINNTVNEVGGTISGGFQNTSTGAESSVGGGYFNISSGGQATVAGGYQNSATGQQATVAGGNSNGSTNSYATVGGGSLNISGGFAATVSGGAQNMSTGSRAVVGGGQFNFSTGSFAMIPGGELNLAAGTSSFAAGFRAKANNDGAFVWADTQNADFSSTANDQVSFRCLGGVRFTSGSGAANQTVSWTPGSASWTFSSDRALKEDFAAVDPVAVLEKVTRLPISEWNYKGYPQRHIGAMAQDFHEAFPLNESTTTLNDADLHGVALAAIQGLNHKVEEQAKAIEAKDARIADLEQRLSRIEKMISISAETR
jgi:hypothetical protein